MEEIKTHKRIGCCSSNQPNHFQFCKFPKLSCIGLKFKILQHLNDFQGWKNWDSTNQVVSNIPKCWSHMKLQPTPIQSKNNYTILISTINSLQSACAGVILWQPNHKENSDKAWNKDLIAKTNVQVVSWESYIRQKESILGPISDSKGSYDMESKLMTVKFKWEKYMIIKTVDSLFILMKKYFLKNWYFSWSKVFKFFKILTVIHPIGRYFYFQEAWYVIRMPSKQAKIPDHKEK